MLQWQFPGLLWAAAVALVNAAGMPVPAVLQAAAVGLVAAILRRWCRTLRFEADAATQARLANADEAMAIVIWHNRLFISAEYFSRYRTRRSVYALVSASKDGALIAEFYRMVGLKPLRGSSSNFARESGKALIDVMRAGHDIGITPDGPRIILTQPQRV